MTNRPTFDDYFYRAVLVVVLALALYAMWAIKLNRNGTYGRDTANDTTVHSVGEHK